MGWRPKVSHPTLMTTLPSGCKFCAIRVIGEFVLSGDNWLLRKVSVVGIARRDC